MFGSVTSPKRKRVSTLRLIHSLARRACILNGSSEHGAVQLSRIPVARPPQGGKVTVRAGKTSAASAYRVLKTQLTSGDHLTVNERRDRCEDRPAERPGEHTPDQRAALETCVVLPPCEIRCVGDHIREELSAAKGQC
jgi:hypothetical protein